MRRSAWQRRAPGLRPHFGWYRRDKRRPAAPPTAARRSDATRPGERRPSMKKKAAPGGAASSLGRKRPKGQDLSAPLLQRTQALISLQHEIHPAGRTEHPVPGAGTTDHPRLNRRPIQHHIVVLFQEFSSEARLGDAYARNLKSRCGHMGGRGATRCCTAKTVTHAGLSVPAEPVPPSPPRTKHRAVPGSPPCRWTGKGRPRAGRCGRSPKA